MKQALDFYLMDIPLWHLHHSMKNMHLIIAMLFLVLAVAQGEGQFTYNGFKGVDNFHLDGLAYIHPNGLLQMANFTVHKTAHAFYKTPMIFKPNLSFSTTFAFAMYPQVPDNKSGHGVIFVISPTMNFQHAFSSEYLGLFNVSNNGLSSNHVFGVELDTLLNPNFGDINGNHVGIDVNSLKSVDAAPASYFSDKEGVNKSLLLNSGKPMQVWIDYDEKEMLVNVTLAPIRHRKPTKCLLSKHVNLSSVFLDSMYVGFSSSSGLLSNNVYLLGWSWNQSGKAQDLDHSKLPSLPRFNQKSSLNLPFLILLIVASVLLLMITGAVWAIRRRRYAELKEPWEQQYAPHRFSYKDLCIATKGFKNSELLGVGGFGKVYKGILPSSSVQVAVKRVSHDSRQGMKEFVAEIASMGRLRHRNLVQLLGYCRRKGELLLVYEYMPNGSLDKFLFGKYEKTKLGWSQRFKIIKGVASALLYLHEEWEQVVLHRDVKASNVLLDAEMNAQLGDFGLARLYDHNTDPRTTHVVGTMGYIAPEASRTRKPTTRTDVYAFGMFLQEVACGRRIIELQDAAEDILIIDWVHGCWRRGAILEASDPRLEGNYVTEEMEMVLKLGLLCSNPKAEARPTMRQVVQFLDRSANLPEIPPDYDPEGKEFLMEGWGNTSSFRSSFPSSTGNASELGPSTTDNSVLHCGR